ncbi:Altered inheritance of mitochondria protein 9, mitochondrial [Hypsizygus marmoreus]|uniref:Altered inheritance of mitochondria protein 9, mitochondrial n=1 Tax=Hypsizygus marmoreus TaxID=39966 RepID=A0A369K2N7_HYPMA|nr:Altered inheritance of mitochondria protein 9, mitochondrial [Hypsizygus marmoreus]
MFSTLKRNAFRKKCKEPLFSFTSGKWLSNHEAQAGARYVPFNVPEIHRIAAKAVGARTVTSMDKIGESINRVFLVHFDGGQHAILRFPTSLSGPPHYTTASEVATMDFLRRLGLPVPKVLAWSSQSTNPVGAEYIIMEPASGMPVAKVWDKIEVGDLAKQVATLLRPLVDLRFKYYGSLYYKDDVPKSKRVCDFLEQLPPGLDASSFCLGPVTRPQFWEGERATMDIERGPWSDAEDYLFDIATREQKWIDLCAKPSIHDDHLCGLPLQGKQDDHIELLQHYKDLIPFLVPKNHKYLSGHLWHPDLHRGNIFVNRADAPDETTGPAYEVSSIIDWQNAWIGPAFLQLTVPLLFEAHLGVPSGFRLAKMPAEAENLPTDDRAEAQAIHKAAIIHKAFEFMAIKEVVPLVARKERIDLEEISHVTWKMGLLPFREALLHVRARWEKFGPGYEFPINFTAKEVDEHRSAYAYWTIHRKKAKQLDDEFGLGEFGYVEGDDAKFEAIKMALEKRREIWVAEAGDDPEAREIRASLWPYRDTLKENPRKHMKAGLFQNLTTKTNILPSTLFALFAVISVPVLARSWQVDSDIEARAVLNEHATSARNIASEVVDILEARAHIVGAGGVNRAKRVDLYSSSRVKSLTDTMEESNHKDNKGVGFLEAGKLCRAPRAR